MNAYPRRGRSLILLAVSGAALAGLTACGAGSVPAGQVGSTIVTQLKNQNVTVDNDTVTCPADLPAEVGQTVRCGFTTGGQPVDAVAKVGSVQDGTVNFDVTTEAKPVAVALLEKTVGEQLAKNNVPAERTTCAGELQPQVGQSTTCTATVNGQDVPLTVTVTEVRGGLVNFSIAQA